jgi:hypothetical protein
VTKIVFQQIEAALQGVRSLAYSASEQALYTATGSEIRRFPMPSDLSSIGVSSATVSGNQLTSVHMGNGRLYVIGDDARFFARTPWTCRLLWLASAA